MPQKVMLVLPLLRDIYISVLMLVAVSLLIFEILLIFSKIEMSKISNESKSNSFKSQTNIRSNIIKNSTSFSRWTQ